MSTIRASTKHSFSLATGNEIALSYVPVYELDEIVNEKGSSIMGVISYGAKPVLARDAQFPVAHVDMPQLGDTPFAEVWTSQAPLKYGEKKAIKFSKNENVLFGYIKLFETDKSQIETITNKAYTRIVSFLRTEGFPHILRVWNYLPNINREENQLERYKSFCVGRAIGFKAGYGNEDSSWFPSGSAIGCNGEGLSIYFIASREPGVHMENPRQEPAYKYPSCYGPSSPSFSRATYMQWPTEKHFYTSGTASVVGHKSKHIGDVEKQFKEIIRNLSSLIGHASDKNDVGFDTLEDVSFLKIYIKYAKDYDLIRSRIEKHFGAQKQAIYLLGDICRSDLLLEIESVFMKPKAD